MQMKDLDKLSIEQIIRLPFFHSLEKNIPDPKNGEVNIMWKITFRCNKVLYIGRWGLLDEESDNEYMVRYKLIDFKHY